MAITQANILDEFMRAGRLQQAGRLAEAAALWREITTAAPQSPEAHANFAAVLVERGDLHTAEAEIRQALALQPDAAWARYQLGRVLHQARRFEAAAAAYQSVLALDPQDTKARLALGHLHLTLGDLPRGWPLYEARCELADQHAAPLLWPNAWRGEPLAGKRLLIWPEQGFGDQIQFARFAPVLQAMGAEVTLAAPPELAALFAGLGVRVIRQTRVPPPMADYDHWTLLLSIPGRLGTTLESLPQPSYLAAPADRRERWAGYVLPGTVGLAWRGRPSHPNDAHRSLPSPEPLLRGLEAAGARVIDLTYPLGDFADLAAVAEQLELVVSVDTALAHLAGALGKRSFVLLPWLRTDWRWLEGRADSPWHPSLRLFRQPRHGDWETVIGEVCAAYAAEFGIESRRAGR